MKTQKNKLYCLVLLLVVAFNFSLVHAKMTKFDPKKNTSNEVPTAQSDAKNLGAILNEYKINSEHVSLQILDGDKEIFAVNAHIKKIPASVTKILTAFAVLKKLPLGHKFYTRVLTDGNNLYLQGAGDPAFVSENMWALVNELARSNIKKVAGNIIVDDSYFDKIRFDNSREDQRVDRAYDSPVGAMSFNWNAVNVFVRPATEGAKAHVFIDPDNDYFDLVNNTQVVKKPKKELVVSISHSEKTITVSGEVAVDAKEKAIYKGILDPALWSGANLNYFLNARDIEVTGKVITGKTPSDAKLIVQHESKDLSIILSDMNKFSNNFIAEMLTKNLAAFDNKTSASLKQGVDIIKQELFKAGIGNAELTIENPSGLTRNNLFSAGTLNRVLQNIKSDFSIYPTFLNSLPVAGIDGTLRKRMKNTTAQGWVRAKTGNLDGVISLAGYAGKPDGKVLTFSFLYNGPRDESSVREAFDKLIINSLK